MALEEIPSSSVAVAVAQDTQISVDEQCVVCAVRLNHLSAEEKEKHLESCLMSSETILKMKESNFDCRDEVSKCFICGMDLGLFDILDRQQHLNVCCDRNEEDLQFMNNAESKEKMIQSLKPMELDAKVFSCFSCQIDLSKNNVAQRMSHLKKCSGLDEESLKNIFPVSSNALSRGKSLLKKRSGAVAAENVVDSLRNALETVNSQIKKLKIMQRDLEVKLERALYLQTDSTDNPPVDQAAFFESKEFEFDQDDDNEGAKELPVDEDIPATQAFSSSSLASSKSRRNRIYDLSINPNFEDTSSTVPEQTDLRKSLSTDTDKPSSADSGDSVGDDSIIFLDEAKFEETPNLPNFDSKLTEKPSSTVNIFLNENAAENRENIKSKSINIMDSFQAVKTKKPLQTPLAEPIFYNLDWIDNLSVDELKAKMKFYGLRSGGKAYMIKELRQIFKNLPQPSSTAKSSDPPPSRESEHDAAFLEYFKKNKFLYQNALLGNPMSIEELSRGLESSRIQFPRSSLIRFLQKQNIAFKY